MISVSFFLPQAVCQQDTLVEQFGFRRDEIISAKLYLGANNPAGLATSSHATERVAERWPPELLYGPTNHTCQGYGPGRQLRWAQQMDFCLSRLRLTNKETDPAAIPAWKQTRRLRAAHGCFCLTEEERRNSKTPTIYDLFLVRKNSLFNQKL